MPDADWGNPYQVTNFAGGLSCHRELSGSAHGTQSLEFDGETRAAWDQLLSMISAVMLDAASQEQPTPGEQRLERPQFYPLPSFAFLQG
jgi:hypothetical protein